MRIFRRNDVKQIRIFEDKNRGGIKHRAETYCSLRRRERFRGEETESRKTVNLPDFVFCRKLAAGFRPPTEEVGSAGNAAGSRKRFSQFL